MPCAGAHAQLQRQEPRRLGEPYAHGPLRRERGRGGRAALSKWTDVCSRAQLCCLSSRVGDQLSPGGGASFVPFCLALFALPCLALFALPCLALPCLALPCLALPCLALPCLALPCLALFALPCLVCLALRNEISSCVGLVSLAQDLANHAFNNSMDFFANSDDGRCASLAGWPALLPQHLCCAFAAQRLCGHLVFPALPGQLTAAQAGPPGPLLCVQP